MEFQLCFGSLNYDGVRVHAVVKVVRDRGVEQVDGRRSAVKGR